MQAAVHFPGIYWSDLCSSILMLWDKARYFENALQSRKSREIVRLDLPPAPTVHAPSAQVRLLSVPMRVLKSPMDPLTESLKSHSPAALVLQLDPMLYLSRFKWIQFAATQAAAKTQSRFQFTDYVPRSLQECTVNLQVLDILAQGKDLKQKRSFGLYMDSVMPPKDMEGMTGELLKAIKEHVYDGVTMWPYMQLAVFPAVMSRIPVILGDLPEVQARMMLGNTLSLAELRGVFAHIMSVLGRHYEKQTMLLTTETAITMLYSHLFSPIKDRYFAALLRRVALTYTSVDAWIGAPHTAPLLPHWADVPEWAEASAIPPRRAEDSDEDLIEKQVILDVLYGSNVWSNPVLSNSFPYLSPSLTPEKLLSSKRVFHDRLTKYQSILSRIKLPAALQQKLQNS